MLFLLASPNLSVTEALPPTIFIFTFQSPAGKAGSPCAYVAFAAAPRLGRSWSLAQVKPFGTCAESILGLLILLFHIHGILTGPLIQIPELKCSRVISRLPPALQNIIDKALVMRHSFLSDVQYLHGWLQPTCNYLFLPKLAAAPVCLQTAAVLTCIWKVHEFHPSAKLCYFPSLELLK